MRIAIIGANGQLGSTLVDTFGDYAIPLTHNDVDVTKYETLEILEKIKPEAIINTAAYVRVDDAERYPKKAFAVNSIGALNIAKISKQLDAVNVYISTDYVFDGKKDKLYTEEDTPNPINIYGLSKYAGEIFTRNYSKKYYIIRVASLYGRGGARGKGGNFVGWIVEKAKRNEPLKIVMDQTMSPTYTIDVAKTLKRFIELEPEYGVYHMTNSGYCTWYDFVKAIFDILDWDVSVEPIPSSELNRLAQRPAFSALENAKLKKIGLVLPHWKDTLKRFLISKKKNGEHMKRNLLISIITPTYNHKKYIAQCIESVLSQTYPNWEMIIIDDGSTDKTPDVVAKYDDERIKYFRQKNKGIWRLSETYNEALKHANGELVAILEGDDFWPADKLEKQISYFKKREVTLTWGIAGITNSAGKVLRFFPEKPKNLLNLNNKELFRKMLHENLIPAVTAMCRKDALLTIGGFKQAPYTPFVDYPTWLNLGITGKLYFSDDVLGYWRRHSNQISQKKDIELGIAGRRYALEFYMDLPANFKKSLEIDIKELKKYHNNIIAGKYFHSGRVALYNKNWKHAKDMFIKAFKHGNYSLKTKAASGFIFGVFRLNMEWLNAIFKMPPL